MEFKEGLTTHAQTASPIYCIYCFKLDRSGEGVQIDYHSRTHMTGVRERVWGWFPMLTDAQSTLLKSPGWIFEDGYYDRALIEEIHSGIVGTTEVVGWFKATYDKETGKTTVEETEPLRCFRSTVNFCMG